MSKPSSYTTITSAGLCCSFHWHSWQINSNTLINCLINQQLTQCRKPDQAYDPKIFFLFTTSFSINGRSQISSVLMVRENSQSCPTLSINTEAEPDERTLNQVTNWNPKSQEKGILIVPNPILKKKHLIPRLHYAVNSYREKKPNKQKPNNEKHSFIKLIHTIISISKIVHNIMYLIQVKVLIIML